jgi:hypothetical protein
MNTPLPESVAEPLSEMPAPLKTYVPGDIVQAPLAAVRVVV